MKTPLQSIYSIALRTAREALDYLGWQYEEGDEGGFRNISCDCGGEIEFYGFVGTDQACCTKCEKRMQDGLGIVQTGNATAGLISLKDYSLDEMERHWLAIKPEPPGEEVDV